MPFDEIDVVKSVASLATLFENKLFTFWIKQLIPRFQIIYQSYSEVYYFEMLSFLTDKYNNKKTFYSY